MRERLARFVADGLLENGEALVRLLESGEALVRLLENGEALVRLRPPRRR